MNRRRRLLAALGAATLSAQLPAFAQRRLPRIGYLLLSPQREPPTQERQAFLDGLRDYGHVPGINVELVYRSAEGNAEFLDAMSRELLEQKVDLVVTSGAEATTALRKATATVPIVFLALGDPVGVGVVKSLSRPGGNVTGISFLSADLAAKRVQMLRDVAPGTRRIAVLWDAGNRNAEIEAEAAVVGARRLSIAIVRVPLRSNAGIDATLRQLATSAPHALYVAFGQGAVAEHRTTIAAFALRERVPLISGWDFMTEGGGLLSYAPNIPSMFRRGAYYVDRILRGANPANLPVEQASTIELVVNARTAKAIGIMLPQSLLLRADKVIE